jgi:hypothetical protein
MPRVLVGDFGEGHVEGSGKVGTGTIEVGRPAPSLHWMI